MNRTISQYEHEGIMVRLERTMERLWILVIMLIILLVATNGAWLVYTLK